MTIRVCRECGAPVAWVEGGMEWTEEGAITQPQGQWVHGARVYMGMGGVQEIKVDDSHQPKPKV